MKIQHKQVPAQQAHVAANPQLMKKTVKNQEAIFQKKLDSVDDSKTKTQTDKYGNQITSYYDRNGAKLYTKVNAGDGSQLYGYTTKDGEQVTFVDRDNDGNMDRMDYNGLNSKGAVKTMFQAFDKNDDGTFDVGMPCTGSNAGKEFNIKG